MNNSQNKFDVSIHANISCYQNKDGVFDIKQFISSVDQNIKEDNKTKARNIIIELNTNFEEERKLRNLQMNKPKKRQIQVVNTKIDQINQRVNNKVHKLQKFIKDFQNDEKNYQAIEKLVENIKLPQKPQDIERKIDRMQIQDQQISLFHFEQMEKILS